MAKIGRPAKRDEDRQGHRDSPSLQIVKKLDSDSPTVALALPPDESWLDQTKSDWEDYWSSDLAKVTDRVDLPILRRLFRMYDQWERASAVADESMLVAGSKGQVRLNPLLEYTAKLDAQILRLETELGKTPLARQRLGLAIGQTQLTAEQLNRMMKEDNDGDTDSEQIVEAEILKEFDTA